MLQIRRIRHAHFTLLLPLLPLLLVAVVAVVATPLRAEEPVVVVETTIIGDWVQQLVGNDLQVHSLVERGQDPHAVRLAPRARLHLEQATAIILIGGGLTPGVDRYASTYPDKTLTLLRALGLDAACVGHHDHDHVAHGHDHHAHGSAETDPHFWLDPSLVRQALPHLGAHLQRTLPAAAARVTAGLQRYDTQLADLDRWITEQVATVAPARRVLITGHAAFGRFAARYGFRTPAAIYGLSTVATDPPPQQMAALIDIIRQQKIPAIFPEQTHSDRLLRAIANQTEATLAPALATASLGDVGSPTGTYLDLMRFNVTTIVTNLR